MAFATTTAPDRIGSGGDELALRLGPDVDAVGALRCALEVEVREDPVEPGRAATSWPGR